MGGLAPVVRLLSDVRPLRIGAAAVIATAASNNPTFQGMSTHSPRASRGRLPGAHAADVPLPCSQVSCCDSSPARWASSCPC